MSKFLINGIYRATEGEGVFVGTPQVFVRFQGCTIGCTNCDSKDTWDFSGVPEMSVEEILAAVHDESYQGSIRRVSITGGDPLHPKNVPAVLELSKILKRKGFFVNLEAAGTRIVHEIFDIIDYISFDFKTPSTGVRGNISLLEKMTAHYPGRFQVKSVVQDEADFRAALSARETLASRECDMNFPWVLTPAYNLGEEFPLSRFENAIVWNEQNGSYFRVIGQQHKWLHGPDKKFV